MPEKNLKEIARKIRMHVLEMITRTKSAHIGSSFSSVEILTALYFRILKIDPNNPQNLERDRLIVSKGHVASGLYATLAVRGFIEVGKLDEYYVNGGPMHGHVSQGDVPGVEVSTGSLGHGLPVGNGIAYAAKKDNKSYRTFVLLSDGECDEGSNWEAILFAGHHKLDNLVAIVDYNKWQSFGRTSEVLNLEPFVEKWKSFNWAVREVNGHDVEAIVSTLEHIPFEVGKPSVLIAHTIKGKGLVSLEDKLESHYLQPSPEEIQKIIDSINRI